MADPGTAIWLVHCHQDKKVSIDINRAGSWRNLGVFDVTNKILQVLNAVEVLMTNSTGYQPGNCKLRIVDASDERKPVLMYWTHATGWEEARHAGR